MGGNAPLDVDYELDHLGVFTYGVQHHRRRVFLDQSERRTAEGLDAVESTFNRIEHQNANPRATAALHPAAIQFDLAP